MSKLNYDFLLPALRMPPLKHQPFPQYGYDVMASEVADYLVRLPSVRQKIFNMAKDHGFIVYDSETQTWKGANV